MNICLFLLPGQRLRCRRLHPRGDDPVVQTSIQAFQCLYFRDGEEKMAVEGELEAQDLHRSFLEVFLVLCVIRGDPVGAAYHGRSMNSRPQVPQKGISVGSRSHIEAQGVEESRKCLPSASKCESFSRQHLIFRKHAPTATSSPYVCQYKIFFHHNNISTDKRSKKVV